MIDLRCVTSCMFFIIISHYHINIAIATVIITSFIPLKTLPLPNLSRYACCFHQSPCQLNHVATTIAITITAFPIKPPSHYTTAKSHHNIIVNIKLPLPRHQHSCKGHQYWLPNPSVSRHNHIVFSHYHNTLVTRMYLRIQN